MRSSDAPLGTQALAPERPTRDPSPSLRKRSFPLHLGQSWSYSMCGARDLPFRPIHPVLHAFRLFLGSCNYQLMPCPSRSSTYRRQRFFRSQAHPLDSLLGIIYPARGNEASLKAPL